MCLFQIWLRKAFLSLLAIFGTLHSNGNIFPFLLCFSLFFFSQLFVRPPQIAILVFLHFFSMGMVLIPVSYTMSRTSIHSSSGSLSIRFRLKLKKVGETTRPFRYDLSQIPYDYTVEPSSGAHKSHLFILRYLLLILYICIV